MRRCRTLGLATLVSAGALIVFAFGATSAHAVSTFDFQFGSGGTGAGQFSAPSDIAINQTTEDVYVTDRGSHRVSRFNAAGEFQRMWGKDVVSAGPGNTGTGFEICVPASGDTCKTGVAGSASGEFNQPQGIGVDSATGAVYVQDASNIRVQKFDANGQFVLMWGKAVNQTTGGNICTASSGDICQVGSPSGDPNTLEPTALGEFYRWQGGGANEPRPALTVDSQGYVYVGECCSIPQVSTPLLHEFPVARVQKFDSSGNFVSVLAPTKRLGHELRNSRSLTVNAAGTFYLRDDTFDSAATGIYEFAPTTFTPEGSPEPITTRFWGEGSGFAELPFDLDSRNQFLIAAESSCIQLPGGSEAVHLVEYHPSSEEVDCTRLTATNVPTVPTMAQSKAIATNPTGKMYLLVDGTPDRVMVFDIPSATSPTVVGDPLAKEISSTKAVIRSQIAANLDDTTFHAEYGTTPCSVLPNDCVTTSESASIGAAVVAKPTSVTITGLAPDTDYYFRTVASNGAGSTSSADVLLHTYPSPGFDPSCGNNLARQQTQSALLPDCRAYELVSPEQQGGYDLESDVIPGQTPFPGFPEATDRALFGIHNGGIPGVGKPTNRGLDPYIARRDAGNQRWTTDYVGIPADAPSAEPFSSTLAEADSRLGAFAFGGPEICDPCFPDGSAGLPLRGTDGALNQGMIGSEPVAGPVPSGEVRKHFSADGSHFIFASEQQFEPEGNPDDGNVTIYDRDLDTGSTQVVSTLPTGQTIANGDEVVALDVSADGSRVLIGNLVTIDSAGNRYWDLYMHVGTSSNSVEVADTPSGVLYSGMTSDGLSVFATTPDSLVTAQDQDTDTSADLFRVDVATSSATTTRLSTGDNGTGDVDTCDPSANSYNPENWNVVPGGPTDCTVVAVGGGGGVGSAGGAIYFLSPELLDDAAGEDGIDGAPNLYLAESGSEPRYVTTLESSATTPLSQTPGFDSYMGAFTKPFGAAIDAQDGSTYVYDIGNAGFIGGPGAYVQKFDASGEEVESYGTNSKNNGSGSGEAFQSIGDPSFLASELGFNQAVPTQIAVDNYPGSASYGDLYVPSTNELAGFHVRKFSSSGAYESSITVASELVFPGAVTVDHSTGKLYVGVINLFGANSVRVYDPNGTFLTSYSVSGRPLGLAVDSGANKLYVATGSKVEVRNATTGAVITATLDPNAARGVVIDPVNGRLYVDEGNRLRIYSNDAEVGVLGDGLFSGSVNLAANSNSLVVSNPGGSNVAVFRPQTQPGRAYDHPLVIHSVSAAEDRHTDDFQTTPDGSHAVFPSTLALTGNAAGNNYQVFRYTGAGGELDCVSCNPTLEVPITDARLASNGLSVTDDGRTFFTTGERLALRDTNGVRDVYQWADGPAGLISSGQDRSDSSLLTVTSNGVDVFFFTRDTLAANDRNGSLIKLYDAREEGGFFFVPPPPGCRASDECHGASSPPPPAIVLGTLKGRGGNHPARPSCDARLLTRRSQQHSRQAAQLRRRALKANAEHRKKLRARATSAAKAARRDAAAAKRCRQELKGGR